MKALISKPSTYGAHDSNYVRQPQAVNQRPRMQKRHPQAHHTQTLEWGPMESGREHEAKRTEHLLRNTHGGQYT